MKIVDARIIVCSPGRNFVTLKITTEDGIYGLGDATLNGRELAVASYLSDHLAPLLIVVTRGKSRTPGNTSTRERIGRGGPVTMTAIAAVDTALWDIKGKALQVPVYQLLGGRSRDSIMVYGHANGETVDKAVEAVDRFVKLGYQAVRVQSGIPGLASTYGVDPKTQLYYEPAAKGRPPRISGAPRNTWPCAEAVRARPKGIRSRYFTFCTTPSPSDAHRGRAVANRWSPIACSG